MNSIHSIDRHFERVSLYSLAVTLWIGVLVMFLPGRWINPSLLQAGLFILATAWGVALARRPFAVRFTWAMVPLACMVAWGLGQLATGHTVGRWDTSLAVLGWLADLAAFFLALQVTATPRGRNRFLDLLLYFGFVLAVVSVVQYFSSEGKVFWFYPTDDPAVLGPFLSRDRYAAFMELLLPIALTRMLTDRRPLRFALMAATLFASVIAGASRAGALLMTAQIILIPLLAWKRGKLPGRMRSAGGVWLLTLIFTAVVGWTVVWTRLQDPDPMKGRREILIGSVAMVRAQPYFGFGLGNFQSAYTKYAVVDLGRLVNAAHNDWVEWAADGGIPFSLLAFCIAAWSFPRALRSLWGIGILAVFVHSTVDFPLQSPVLQAWLFALLGSLAGEGAGAERNLGSHAD